MSPVMRKPTFCICENKDADQLRGNREADQRLCFRYLDGMIPLLSKSEISSLWPSPVAVQPGLCRTRSETRMLVFSRRGSYFGCLKFSRLHYTLHYNADEYDQFDHSLNHVMRKSAFCIQGKTNEPRHEKTNVLHMQKQRRRSASR